MHPILQLQHRPYSPDPLAPTLSKYALTLLSRALSFSCFGKKVLNVPSAKGGITIITSKASLTFAALKGSCNFPALIVRSISATNLDVTILLTSLSKSVVSSCASRLIAGRHRQF